MKIIADYSDYIEEEIHDAEKYARKAIECKEMSPQDSEVFYKLANEELNHMNAIHGLVVAKIEAYKKQNGEPPEAMKFLYDILHKKHIQNVATVKGMLALYKGEK